jgi:hypothetical protein
MGTVDQPKPTEPKSPVGGQPPLQPGQTDSGLVNRLEPTRKNPQTPEIVKEEFEEPEIPHHHKQ